MIFLWVLPRTSNSARLHFVPPMSPARITSALPPPAAGGPCRLGWHGTLLMRERCEHRRSRFIHEKKLLPIMAGLHKLSGIGRIGLGLQNSSQDFRLFRAHNQED